MASYRTAAGLIATTPHVRTAAGLVPCRATIRTAAGLVETEGGAAPFSASVQPQEAYGASNASGSRLTTTNQVTIAPAGGRAPYTVAWTGDDPGFDATAPTALTTAFRAVATAGEPRIASFTATVTDANGATAAVIVTATVSNFGMGGPYA